MSAVGRASGRVRDHEDDKPAKVLVAKLKLVAVGVGMLTEPLWGGT